MISPHAEYLALAESGDAREAAYRELFRHQLDPGLIDEMRHALNHELVVGQSRFKEEIAALTLRRVEFGIPGRPKRG